MARRRGLAIASGLLLVGAGLVWGRFDADLDAARFRAAAGSRVIDTPCGAIEYQEAGAGVPLLAVHGSGGGFDQGMAFAAPLAAKGVRVIAMSRFGYLRSPMPEDASAEAQADAFACLLDALDIDKAAVTGGSAGALSALQMARSGGIPRREAGAGGYSSASAGAFSGGVERTAIPGSQLAKVIPS